MQSPILDILSLPLTDVPLLYSAGSRPRYAVNCLAVLKSLLPDRAAMMIEAVCMPMPGIVVRLFAFCLSSGFWLMYVFRRPSASFIFLPR